MGKILRSAILVLAFSCLTAAAAKADTLTYDLTGPYGFELAFDLPQNPTFTSTSFGYIVPVTGLTIGPTSITSLDFFSSSHGGGLGADGVQLSGDQLYSFTGGPLVLSTGTFSLDAYRTRFTLLVTDGDTVSTPEPSSLLLLASGLAGVAFMIRKNLARN